MKKYFLFLLALCLVFACAFAEEEVKIAFSIHDLSTARSVSIASDIISCAREQGYAVTIRNAEQTLKKQIGDIEEMLLDEPDYLIISSVKSIGLKDTIRAAAEKGVKVIMVEGLASDADDAHILSNIGIDAEKAGARCAQLLADYFDGREASILEIQGTAGSWQSHYFAKGFRDALCSCENIQISGVIQGNSNRQDTQKALLEYIENLSGDQEFDAIFGHGDEEGIGAVNIYLSIRPYSGSTTPIVCIGGHDDVMRALAAGRIHACLKVPPEYGRMVADTIERDLQGLEVEHSQLVDGTAVLAADTEIMRGY